MGKYIEIVFNILMFSAMCEYLFNQQGVFTNGLLFSAGMIVSGFVITRLQKKA